MKEITLLYKWQYQRTDDEASDWLNAKKYRLHFDPSKRAAISNFQQNSSISWALSARASSPLFAFDETRSVPSEIRKFRQEKISEINNRTGTLISSFRVGRSQHAEWILNKNEITCNGTFAG